MLHTFDGADGANPYGGLIRDSLGNLYGTTRLGGTNNWGTVFKLDTAGNLTTLYSFTNGSDGAYPNAGLVRDSKGNLYGAAATGGIGHGTIFEITP